MSKIEDVPGHPGLVRVKDNDLFGIYSKHPANAVAEYCFGKLCEDHYRKFKEFNPGYKYDYIEKAFRCAIDKYGLTYEISTDDPKRAGEIWEKVEGEIMNERE